MSNTNLKKIDIDDFFQNEEDTSQANTIRLCVPKKPFRLLASKPMPFVWLSRWKERWYLIHPDIVASGVFIPNLCRAYLYPGMMSNGDLFVLPVTKPINGESTSWSDAWDEIVPVAKKQWTEITTNSRDHRHDYEVVTGLGKPAWPDIPMKEWLERAISGRVVQDEDHPLLNKPKKARHSGFDFEVDE
jgi:hypothetical protein